MQVLIGSSSIRIPRKAPDQSRIIVEIGRNILIGDDRQTSDMQTKNLAKKERKACVKSR